LLLPAKTALLLAFFSVLALALSIAGLAMVDRDARRIAAAEAAQRDFEALDEKLPGVIGDPSALPLLASVVGRSANMPAVPASPASSCSAAPMGKYAEPGRAGPARCARGAKPSLGPCPRWRRGDRRSATAAGRRGAADRGRSPRPARSAGRWGCGAEASSCC
jgi:hypothetical protein